MLFFSVTLCYTDFFFSPAALASFSFSVTTVFSFSELYNILLALIVSGGLVVAVHPVPSVYSNWLSLCRGPAKAREMEHWPEETGVSHGMKHRVSNRSPSVQQTWKTGWRKAQECSLYGFKGQGVKYWHVLCLILFLFWQQSSRNMSTEGVYPNCWGKQANRSSHIHASFVDKSCLPKKPKYGGWVPSPVRWGWQYWSLELWD